MSLSSCFPFKAWHSWYLRTPHTKINATSLLSKTLVISSKPRTWPDSETTLTAASSTCSTDMSSTLEARASREAAIRWCCAAMSDKSPWRYISTLGGFGGPERTESSCWSREDLCCGGVTCCSCLACGWGLFSLLRLGWHEWYFC